MATAASDVGAELAPARLKYTAALLGGVACMALLLYLIVVFPLAFGGYTVAGCLALALVTRLGGLDDLEAARRRVGSRSTSSKAA
mmetsp:Transcript_42295/g.95564  ORF Transcript_42295/g.95564 Transcript_42295/m.95564 type:complete len:85 (-) Transcript_42295:338-592(-)